MSDAHQFTKWFVRATGKEPYPFQTRFACGPELPQLVDVPTGMGKTAMAMLGWLWRRRFAEEKVRKATPRRLVYCLPMRVLVEQTKGESSKWIAEIQKRYPTEMVQPLKVHVLMGGEDEEDWDIYPEYDQIIIGTQDMLLSRVLNRGYAATRSRWPVKFGLLNTDCLWMFDEIQLMGAGLATTAQLEAFRRLLPDKDSDRARNGHGCRSVWMSATLHRDWLNTVDFKGHADGLSQLALNQDDHRNGEVKTRWTAKKPLNKTEAEMGDISVLAKEVHKAHKPGTRTIVILNTVKRACELCKALDADGKSKSNATEPAIVLLHSRFRPEDRKKQVDKALAEIRSGEPGTIVVSTQVIETGVDVSAATLFTELAPWTSLVQRFGRCNRRGEANDRAAVHWIAMPTKDSDTEKLVAPYELEDLKVAAKQLKKLSDVGLKTLCDNSLPLQFEHTHVIRRKDLIDLFDTTPDLAGNDIDIDRFIRDVEESDVRVFWRTWEQCRGYEPPPEDEPAPRREEICSAPVGTEKNPGFRQFVQKHGGKIWRWNFLEKKWEKADAGKVSPGQVFLIHARAGGYLDEQGWNPDSKTPVVPILSPGGTVGKAEDATDADPLSHIARWQTISEHTDDLCRETDCILGALFEERREAEALLLAARWHDRGKAHEVFRVALPNGSPDPAKIWAKAPGQWKKYNRRHFRHELASALSVLDPRNDKIPDELRNLVAYLVAAHHGKVRLSIRSLPNEKRPAGNRRFARGIWDNDELPTTDLGGDVIAPAVFLSLEPMELGLCEQEPFRGLPSWAERMINIRNTIGPFRLAYLEAILRAADMRASRDAEQRAVAKRHDPVSPPRQGEVAL